MRLSLMKTPWGNCRLFVAMELSSNPLTGPSRSQQGHLRNIWVKCTHLEPSSNYLGHKKDVNTSKIIVHKFTIKIMYHHQHINMTQDVNTLKQWKNTHIQSFHHFIHHPHPHISSLWSPIITWIKSSELAEAVLGVWGVAAFAKHCLR